MSFEATIPISSDKLALASFRVWYHLPISLLVCPRLERNGWKRLPREADFALATYFHPHVATRLVGNSDTAGLERWRRQCVPTPFIAEFDRLNRVDKQPSTRTRLRGELIGVDLVILQQSRICNKSPGLAIATVEIAFNAVAEQAAEAGVWPEPKDEDWRGFMLSDAQNALEWVRRIFPRWYQEGEAVDSVAPDCQITPGNALARVVGFGSSPNMAEMAKDFERTETARVMPWVEKLLSPLKLDGKNASHFGDDRAYTVSSVELEVIGDSQGTSSAKATAAKETLNAVHPGDLYRLAECDTSGSGWPFSSRFLKNEAAVEFYTRHAPILESRDGDKSAIYSGNATLYLMAPHHLCGLGAGDYFGGTEIGHIRCYYRPMQLICLIEFYRLLQISQRLAALVRARAKAGEPGDKELREGLLQLRQDMLAFTHVHHFSNVTSQIQGREMFERLYDVMGISALHDEVETEMSAAAEFAAMRDALDSARRAERLNDVVALGVPVALVVGVAGMNLLVGPDAPEVSWIDGLTVDGDLTLRGHLVQLAGVVAIVFLPWAVLLGWLNRSEQRKPMGFALFGMAAALVWFFGSNADEALRRALGWG